MTSLTMAKYALALAGIALVLYGERIAQRWLGYAGIGLVVIAFFLRFVRREQGPPDAG